MQPVTRNHLYAVHTLHDELVSVAKAEAFRTGWIMGVVFAVCVMGCAWEILRWAA